MMVVDSATLEEMQRLWSVSGAALIRALNYSPQTITDDFEEQGDEVIEVLRYVAHQVIVAREDATRKAKEPA